jgi:CRISPR-associated endonuclease/helicase Cas3
LRLTYHAIQQDAPLTHHFLPYLLEPTPWGDGLYLIGHSDVVNNLLTLKVERITAAAALEKFELPADFDEARLLRHAWGIWGGEGAPETVRLKFAPGAAVRRLRESIWHPLEQIVDLPEGGCLWEAPIADWREMLPWVRGWGAAAEVLAPVGLRLAVVGESRALAEMYGWQTRRRPATMVPSGDESLGGFLSGDK